MAIPLSADSAFAALQKEGVLLRIGSADWRTHTRTTDRRLWGPVHGVMIHHTVTEGTTTSRSILYNGYSGLPGPLCHGMIDKDGSTTMIGWGRTNHAGLGDATVLRRVTAETPPYEPRFASVDGNARFYGFECVNLGNGKDPWPKAQIEGIVKAAAALCRAHGWSANSVIGHKEWQPGKPDPYGPGMPSMDDLRVLIAKRLASKPTPPKLVVKLSLLVEAAKTNPRRTDQKITYAGVKTVEDALVAEGLLAKGLADGHYGTATLDAYKAWQRKLGYAGTDADGIPGWVSLSTLAKKRGFTAER